MSRHYRELVAEHVTNKTVYHRPPYTVAIVEMEWGDGDELKRVTGCGVAKYSTRDREAGLPWDDKRGETIALGRAYQDAWEQRHPTSWAVAFANGLIEGFHEMGRRLLSMERLTNDSGKEA